jgi:hypothetical protein
VDLTPGDLVEFDYNGHEMSDPARIFHAHEARPITSSNNENIAIDSLTLEKYHGICAWNTSRRQTILIFTGMTVTLGAVIASSSRAQLENWVEIASLANVVVFCDCWDALGAEIDGEVRADGWTRYLFHLCR